MGNKSSCCNTNSPTGSSTVCRAARYCATNSEASYNSATRKYNGSINQMGHIVQQNNTSFSAVGRQYNDYDHDSTWTRDETSNNLQHISEREPDDIDQDPSTHPTKGPIFMERSKSEIKIRDNRVSMYFIHNHCLVPTVDSQRRCSRVSPCPPGRLVKANSCSTIFLDDSTISLPHMKHTIKCIALALYYHIAHRRNRGNERLMDIFEERKHPITADPIPIDYELRDPEQKHIYRFIRVLFSSAQLTAECAIITLVYIERLLTYAEIDLCPSNWRRIVLGAIMLASKVWDDQAVWNVDYCQILRRCTVEDMNELERQFLECLEFNINVPSSVYAKYYFDLRTLAIANDLQLPLQPLYKERAKKLEALSRSYEDKYMDIKRRTRRRWNSADRLNGQLKSPVVVIP